MNQPMPFDILGPLPADASTTVLEASAGTGKTYTVGALVARYVAEGVTTLDRMLVITFGRAASQELRERVRDQLVAAERALADPASADPSDALLVHLVSADVSAAAQADHRRPGRVRRRHHRHHPPVLPARAALARRRRRHRLPRRAGREPRRPGGGGDRRPLPPAVRVDARGAAVRSRTSRSDWPGPRSATRRPGWRRSTPSRAPTRPSASTSPPPSGPRWSGASTSAASSPTTTC